MKEFFSSYFKLSFLSNLIYLIFGLLLFINPEGVIVSISVIIGILGIIFGLFELTLYFNYHSSMALISGVFSAVAGIVLVLNTNILAIVIPIIIGISMIMKGIKKIDIAAKFKHHNMSSWSYIFVTAVINILCGIIFVINPITGAVITTKIIGIIVIIYSIISIIDTITFKDKYDQVVKVIEEVK